MIREPFRGSQTLETEKDNFGKECSILSLSSATITSKW